MAKQFVMLVGLPASGKSTYRDEHCSDLFVISSDDLIEEKAKEAGITYSEAFPIHVKWATSELNKRFKQAVSEGRDIVWDQTNLTIKKRVAILDQLPAGYVKTCVLFSCTDELLKERLASREGKHIPLAVIESMKKSFEYPTSSEGFDYVMEVSP